MPYRAKCGAFVALSVSVLASCGRDTSGGGDAAGAAEAPEEIRVDFAAVGGSAAEGTVRLVLEGDAYSAVVSIDTHRGPGDYPIEIHSGSCAATGALVAALTSVEGQEGGEGQSRSTLAASELPAGGSFYIELLDAQDSSLIGCGDLTAM